MKYVCELCEVNQKASGQPQQIGAVSKSCINDVPTTKDTQLAADLKTPLLFEGQWRVLMTFISVRTAGFSLNRVLRVARYVRPRANTEAKTKTSLLTWLPSKCKQLQRPIGIPAKEAETRGRLCVRRCTSQASIYSTRTA